MNSTTKLDPNELVFEEIDSKFFQDNPQYAKESGLIFLGYGDDTKPWADVSVKATQLIETLIYISKDLQQRRGTDKPSDYVTVEVGSLMTMLNIQHIDRMEKLLDTINLLPVQLDVLGDRIKEFFNHFPVDDQVINQPKNKVYAARMKGVMINGYTRFLREESKESEFELRPQNGTIEVLDKQRSLQKWSRSDILQIEWGSPVKACFAFTKSLYAVLDLNVRLQIKTKYGQALYGILKQEFYLRTGQQLAPIEPGQRLFTRQFTAIEFHNLVCSNAKDEKTYWMYHPEFDKDKDPWKNLEIKDGGWRVFLKAVLRRAQNDINENTDLFIEEFKLTRKHRKVTGVYVIFSYKPYKKDLEWLAIEKDSIAKRIGIAPAKVDALSREFDLELMTACVEMFEASKARFEKNGDTVKSNFALYKKILKNQKEEHLMKTQPGLFNEKEIKEKQNLIQERANKNSSPTDLGMVRIKTLAQHTFSEPVNYKIIVNELRKYLSINTEINHKPMTMEDLEKLLESDAGLRLEFTNWLRLSKDSSSTPESE